ncbi:MAG: aminopeptidase, partial [Myxococcota bacterium]
MNTFLSLVRFELRFQLRGPVFFISFAVFFLITFFASVSEQVQIGGPSSVHINDPSAIALTMGLLSLFALFIPTAMLAGTVIRDAEYKAEGMFHSTPVSPKLFVLGRFTGGAIASVLAFSGVPLAIFLATLTPFVDAERLGPNALLNYVYVFAVIGVVNLLVSGLVFFTVSNFTRSLFATYLAL